jgi:cell division protein FtsI/penicillin-binding protein 2
MEASLIRSRVIGFRSPLFSRLLHRGGEFGNLPARAGSIPRAFIAALFVFTVIAAQPQTSGETQIFSLAAKATLEQRFPGADISYVLLDASGAVLAQRWPADSASEAVSPGSLLKPFLALAYGEQHGGEFPIVRCFGTRSRCWYPPGHGAMGLEEALAQSCNAYFLELARSLDRRRAAQTFARFGLAGPPPEASYESLPGLDSAWKETPLTLAQAYLALVREQHSPLQGRIEKGMRGSAAHGTARAVDALLGANAALAKTGTTVCTHHPRGAADGFTVVLYPAAQPRLLLLIRVHGTTGAETAKVAASMLHALGEGTP